MNPTARLWSVQFASEATVEIMPAPALGNTRQSCRTRAPEKEMHNAISLGQSRKSRSVRDWFLDLVQCNSARKGTAARLRRQWIPHTNQAAENLSRTDVTDRLSACSFAFGQGVSQMPGRRFSLGSSGLIPTFGTHDFLLR